LAEGTVRIHMHNIYQKTGIPSRMALISAALAYLERRPKGCGSRFKPLSQ
jgi:hypothetical protein